MEYQAAYFPLPDRSPDWKTVLTAAAIHAAILFFFGNLGVVRAEYRIGSGTTTVEVQLVAAPAPAAEPLAAPPPPVEVKKEEMVVPKKTKKPKPRLAPPLPPPAVQPVSAAISGPQNPGPSNPGPSGARIGLDLQAAYLRNPPPPYPRESRRSGEEGLVLLLVAVNALGEVSELSLKRTSGFSRLDDAALKAVRSWVFKPTQIAGIPSADTVEVPIRFTLKR